MNLLKRLFFLPLFLAWVAVVNVHAADEVSLPIAPVYRVTIDDELSFKFFYLPELNTAVKVRADGRVSLPLVGEVAVQGLTVAALTERVERLMSVHVRRPQVTVNVQVGASNRIFVGGEVTRPGVQPLLGPLTALQAVTVAEGLKDGAQPRSAIVLRRNEAGARVVLPIDLASAMNGSDVSQDLQLQAYDIVIVPRSGIADLGLWVDQYIRRVVPFSLGFSYTINKNGSVQ